MFGVEHVIYSTHCFVSVLSRRTTASCKTFCSSSFLPNKSSSAALQGLVFPSDNWQFMNHPLDFAMRQHICNPYLFPLNNCEGAAALIGSYHLHFTLITNLEEEQRGAIFPLLFFFSFFFFLFHVQGIF